VVTHTGLCFYASVLPFVAAWRATSNKTVTIISQAATTKSGSGKEKGSGSKA
jgi:hypothetical protein